MKVEIAMNLVMAAGCNEKIEALLREKGIEPSRPFEARVEGGIWHVAQDEEPIFLQVNSIPATDVRS